MTIKYTILIDFITISTQGNATDFGDLNFANQGNGHSCCIKNSWIAAGGDQIYNNELIY